MTTRVASSNTEWKRWGEIDPLFGVSSWKGKARGEASSWTDEEFYELGRSDWEDFRAKWERYGLDKAACVEVGCGAGRITRHLSRDFRETHAVDVSEGMIAKAKGHVDAPSVTFHLTDGSVLPLRDGAVTAAFSTHVFQHFDSLDHASGYFAEISRVLGPGGTLLVHLPIYQWPAMKKVFSLQYDLRKRVGNAKAVFRRWLMQRGLSKPIMRGLIYPVDYFYATLPRLQFTDIEVNIAPVKSNNDLHPLIFARKAGG